MSNLGGGDQLASGQKSAQFASAGVSISQFEDDFIFRPEIIADKYGLSEQEIEDYKEDREKGHKLPDLPTVESLKELKDAELKVGFSVKDSRRFTDAMAETHPLGKESKVAVAVKKYSEKKYTEPRPVLDRILIKTINDDPNLELLEDGSVRDKRTGFIVPPQYRQHSNMGIVLSIGDFVIMGGVKTPLSDFIQPGDKVKFGDYNSEVFFLSDAATEKLCDAIQMDFFSDPEGLRIVRVQDVRVIQHPKEDSDG